MVIAILVIAAIAVSGSLGYYASTISKPAGSSQSQNTIVNIDVIPDYGGAGFDAFVLEPNMQNGIVPTAGTNTTAPGTNNNNVTVSAGTTVKFVLTSIDTAILMNYSSAVSTPFTLYNDTADGQAALHYTTGQQISNMPISHTFTIKELGVDIPIPPTTVVTFSMTFSKAGTYMYYCETPCGPGMGLMGYMEGFVIVK